MKLQLSTYIEGINLSHESYGAGLQVGDVERGGVTGGGRAGGAVCQGGEGRSGGHQGLYNGLLSMPLVWKQTKFLKLVCFWSSFCWKVYFFGISHKITMKRCLKPVFINVHLQKCVGANPLKNSHPHLFSNNWQLAEAVLTSFSINILKMWL